MLPEDKNRKGWREKKEENEKKKTIKRGIENKYTAMVRQGSVRGRREQREKERICVRARQELS